MKIKAWLLIVVMAALLSAIGHEVDMQIRWDERVAIPFYGADRVLPVGTTPTMFLMRE